MRLDDADGRNEARESRLRQTLMRIVTARWCVGGWSTACLLATLHRLARIDDAR